MLQVVLGGVMQAWGVQPNQLSYNTIMDAYARQGNVRNVVKIYNFMQVRAPRAARGSERAGSFSLVAAAACVLVSATLNSTTRTDSRPIFSPATRHVAKVVGWPTFLS